MSTKTEKQRAEIEADVRARFAHNVRVLRVKKGIAQDELANLAGLHRTFVSDVERAVRNVAISNIGRIADALETDVMELFRPVEASDEELPTSLPKGPRRNRAEP